MITVEPGANIAPPIRTMITNALSGTRHVAHNCAVCGASAASLQSAAPAHGANLRRPFVASHSLTTAMPQGVRKDDPVIS